MNVATAGLAKLQKLAAAGELDPMCDHLGIAVLTVFGSAAQGAPEPRDLDIGVLLCTGPRASYVDLIDGLSRAAGTDIDLVVLNCAGPVLRERALVGALALYESEPGAWIAAATQAVLERMDTAWLRQVQLAVLAAG